MARLQESILDRVETFCDRVLDVADALAETPCPARILSQFIGSGTSVGANVFEADEAMSRADFVKCLAIAVKELNETRFWLRLIGRRNWIPAARLSGLDQEAVELKRVLGSMIARTKNPTPNADDPPASAPI